MAVKAGAKAEVARTDDTTTAATILPCFFIYLPATWARFGDATHFIGMLGIRDQPIPKIIILVNVGFGPSLGIVSNQGINPLNYFSNARLALVSAL